MKILLVRNYEPDGQYSMLGFADALEQGLKAQGLTPTVISPRPRYGVSRRIPARFAKWAAYVDKFVTFRRELRHEAARHDVVHVLDQGNGLYVRMVPNANTLLTCHDMLAARSALGQLEAWTTGWTGRRFQRMNLDGLRRARVVACVSQATLRDVINLAGRNEGNTKVIYNGMYKAFAPVPRAARLPRLVAYGLNPDRPFFLHVGGNAPYKNRLGVLRIYRELAESGAGAGFDLVMAGQPFTAPMRDYVAQSRLDGRVHELIKVPDSDLPVLYSEARGLIFPSLYEGFGLPIIEAQSCGCPVFSSNRAPMTEVGGDAAVYFDPTDVPSAARLISANLSCAESMAQDGLENVKRFTTERMVAEYSDLYRSTL